MGSCLGQENPAGGEDRGRHGGLKRAQMGNRTDDLEAQAARRALLAGMQRWCLDVSEWDDLSAEQWGVLMALLPEAESSRVKGFLRENDRRLALGSRLLQRGIVSKVFGLNFSEADIRRTKERKPYFAGVCEAILGGSTSGRLKNWNFNVSHHGKYVVIASEPVCLCGVDVVDTNRQTSEPSSAESYLRFFTEHFTDSEWETIRRPVSDRDKLRRFYLNWGLKEAYVKAVGQGLGFDLRRISFVPGEWLNCCRSSKNNGNEVNNSKNKNKKKERRRCSCPRIPTVSSFHSSGFDTSYGGDSKVRAENEKDDVEEEEEEKEEKGVDKGGDWGKEDRLGCVCEMGVATVEVDGTPRPDWSFKVFPLPGGYAVCVARGPPSDCSDSGQMAGVISDPNTGGELLVEGQSLPQLRFRKVDLHGIIPREAALKLRELKNAWQEV